MMDLPGSVSAFARLGAAIHQYWWRNLERGVVFVNQKLTKSHITQLDISLT